MVSCCGCSRASGADLRKRTEAELLDKGLGQGARSDPSPYAQTLAMCIHGVQLCGAFVVFKFVVNTLGFFDAVHRETLDAVDAVGDTVSTASVRMVDAIGNVGVGTADTIKHVTQEVIVKFGQGIGLMGSCFIMCLIAVLLQVTRCGLLCIVNRWEPRRCQDRVVKEEISDVNDAGEPNCAKSPERTRAGLPDGRGDESGGRGSPKKLQKSFSLPSIRTLESPPRQIMDDGQKRATTP